MTDRGGNALAFPSLAIMTRQNFRPDPIFLEETHDMGLRVAFYPYMVYNRVGFVNHTYPRRTVTAGNSDFGGI